MFTTVVGAKRRKRGNQRRTEQMVIGQEVEEASGTRTAVSGPDLDIVVGSPGNRVGAEGGTNALDNANGKYLESTDGGISELFDGGISQMTVQVWVNGDTDTQTAQVFGVGTTPVADTINWYIQNGGSYDRHYINLAGAYFQAFMYRPATVMPWSGGWHQWILNIDCARDNGDEVHLYVDNVRVTDAGLKAVHPGNAIQSVTAPGSLAVTGDRLALGDGFYGVSQFDGGIDKFAVWTYAMTTDEMDYEWNDGNARSLAA